MFGTYPPNQLLDMQNRRMSNLEHNFSIDSYGNNDPVNLNITSVVKQEISVAWKHVSYVLTLR